MAGGAAVVCVWRGVQCLREGELAAGRPMARVTPIPGWQEWRWWAEAVEWCPSSGEVCRKRHHSPKRRKMRRDEMAVLNGRREWK